MLEGIRVLSENTVDNRLGYIILFWLCILLCIASVVVLIYSLKDKDFGLSFICTIFILFGIVFMIFNIKGINTEPHTKYKVTIDNTVNFKEFNDRYEIKDQDGEIYTIVEREKE